MLMSTTAPFRSIQYYLEFVLNESSSVIIASSLLSSHDVHVDPKNHRSASFSTPSVIQVCHVFDTLPFILKARDHSFLECRVNLVILNLRLHVDLSSVCAVILDDNMAVVSNGTCMPIDLSLVLQ
jgi:hypothetical protein